MVNGALPLLADTDVADTLGAGTDLSFQEGGEVPDTDNPLAPARPVPTVSPAAPTSTAPGWEDVPAKTATSAPAPAADEWEDVPPVDTGFKGALRTGAREFTRDILPGITSLPFMGAAAEAVTPLALGAGAAFPPAAWATVPLVYLLAGAAGAYGPAALARRYQDQALQKAGISNPQAEAAEDAAHPYAKLAGSLAMAPLMGSATRAGGTILQGIAQRAAMGGGQAAIEAGQQKLTGNHEIDWPSVAASGAAGAAFPYPRGYIERWANLGNGKPPVPPPPPPQPEPPYTPNFTMKGKPYGPTYSDWSAANQQDLGVTVGGVPNPIQPPSPTPRPGNENAPFVPPEGPRAAANTNTQVTPGVMPAAPGVRMSGVPNPLGGPAETPQAANWNPANPNAGPRATQDNAPPVPPTPAQPTPEVPQTQPEFYAQGAPDFNLAGEPYPGPYEPGQPGSPSMPLSGEILPPGAPDPWSTQNQLGARQTAGGIEGPQGPAEGAPSGGPGLPPPGQRSPGGTPAESPYALRQAPGRPDNNPDVTGAVPPSTDQSQTPVPGGYPGQSAGALVPTKGARAVNVAPAPRPGLTPKSMALIAKSKSEAATSQPTKVGIATAFVNPPPPTSHVTIGNDTSAPFADRNEPGNRDGRGYAKSPTAVENKGAGASATTDDGTGFTPDVTAAINDRVAAVRPRFNANDNSTTPGRPGRRTPGMNAGQRAQAQGRIEDQAAFRRSAPAPDAANANRSINRDHDVPYLAGSSNNGRTTYIDRRVPRRMNIAGKTIDPAKYLTVHEEREHELMTKGEPYESAHREALKAERAAVEADGVDWDHYQTAMKALVHTTEHEGTHAIPPDLYAKPYAHDEENFRKIEAAAASKRETPPPGLTPAQEDMWRRIRTPSSMVNQARMASEKPAVERGPLAQEVAKHHMPWYDRGYRGEPRGGNQAEEAAWDRGANDKMNADRAAERRQIATPEPPPPKPEHPAIARLRQAREALAQRGAERALKELDEGVQSGKVTPAHVEQLARTLEDTRPAWEAAEEAKKQGYAAEPRPSRYAEPPTEAPRDNRPKTATGAIAATVTAARKANFAAQVADHILHEHQGDPRRMPTAGALRDRLAGAIKAYQAEMKAARLSPKLPDREGSPGQKWLQRAKDILQGGELNNERIASFLSDEYDALHPEMHELSAETRGIEGLIAMGRRSGEEALRSAENTRARTEPVQEEYADWGKGHNPDEDTGETRGRENPEHRGWSAIDPEDEDVPGFHEPWTPEELSDMHDKRQLQKNLEQLDHAQHQQARGAGTQRQQFNTTRSKAERLADVDPTHIGTPEQRRQAIEQLAGPPDESTFAKFWRDEGGALDLKKVNEDFAKNLAPLKEIWNKTFKTGWVAPERQGALGSLPRQGALYAASVVRGILAREAQETMHALARTDRQYAALAKPDARWDGKGSRKAYVEKMNDELLAGIESGKKLPTPELQAAADWFRHLNDTSYDIEAQAGSRAYYRNNYMGHMFKNEEEYQRFIDYNVRKYGPSWFQKPRVFEDYAQARAQGFERKFTNVAEIMSQRLIAGAVMRSKMDTLKEFEAAGMAFKTADENPAALKSEGFEEIIAPNNEKYLLAPEVRKIWHNSQDRERSLWLLKGPVGSAFRAWMTAKAIIVPFVLGWSGFHYQHVGYNDNTVAAAMGSAFNGIKTAIGVPKDFKGVAGALRGRAVSAGRLAGSVVPQAAKAVVESVDQAQKAVLGAANTFLNANMRTDRMDPVVHGVEQFARATSEGQRMIDAYIDPFFQRSAEDEKWNQYILEAGLSAAPHRSAQMMAMRGLAGAMGIRDWTHTVMKAGAMFSHLDPVQKFTFNSIQSWKMSQFKRAASELFTQHPEYVNDELLRRPALSTIGRNLDDMYGEALNSTKLWNKIYEGIGRFSLLSMDWQGGQISQEGGAVTNQVRSLTDIAKITTKRGMVEQAVFNANPKTTMMAKYAAGVFMMSGLTTYLLTGQYPEGLDWVVPRDGTVNPDGSPGRLLWPHWSSEWVRARKKLQEYGGGAAAALNAAGDLLYSKTVFAPYIHVATNHDFYNREMADPDAPFLQHIGQRAVSFVREFTPISMQNAGKLEALGGDQTWRKALSFGGLPPAPAYMSRSDTQNQIAHDFYAGAGAGEKLYTYKELEEDKNKLLHAYDLARIQTRLGDAAKLRAEIIKKGYQKPNIVGKHPAGSSDQYMFERLPRPKQIARLQGMTNAEFRRYVTKNSYLSPGDEATRELTAEWKKTHPYWRG